MEAGECFEDAVRANFASGLSRMDSVKKAITDYPAQHADWVKRLRLGEDQTKDLFPAEPVAATVDTKPAIGLTVQLTGIPSAEAIGLPEVNAEQRAAEVKEKLSVLNDKKMAAAYAATYVSQAASVKPEKMHALKAKSHDFF